MNQEENYKKFYLFLEGFGVKPNVHIYTAPSPANMSIFEFLVSTGIALFLIYMFSDIWWVVMFIVIYWIINFIKYLHPFPDIPKATLRFNTDGIEQDKKYFWTWEEIQKESVSQNHPDRKKNFLDNFPTFMMLFPLLFSLIISVILQADMGLMTRFFPKEYYYFSFDTPEGIKIFILETEEIPQHNIIPDYFEKYRIYHKIKKENFNL